MSSRISSRKRRVEFVEDAGQARQDCGRVIYVPSVTNQWVVASSKKGALRYVDRDEKGLPNLVSSSSKLGDPFQNAYTAIKSNRAKPEQFEEDERITLCD